MNFRVHVSLHAIDAYRRRRSDPRSKRELEDEIAELVEGVVSEGRVLNHRPEGFLLFNQPRLAKALPEGQWFAPCGDFGFILKREGKTWIVVTTLTRSGVRAV